jgi:hypothetical protein
MSSIELRKFKLAFFRPHIPASLVDGKVVYRDGYDEDFVRDQLTAQLTGYLWGEPGPTRTIKYPSDWWSAFKLRWFPEWMLRRWPAQYTCHQINLTTLYPDFRVSLPSKEISVLKFDVQDYEASSSEV